MTEPSTLGFAEAAGSLGVSIRLLRQAIRQGKIPAPASGATAVSPLTAEWLAGAKQAAKASPDVFKNSERPKVPAFARYQGTSAWRKYRRRVREFNAARAAAE